VTVQEANSSTLGVEKKATDNTTNGIEVATRAKQVDTGSAAIGSMQTATSVALSMGTTTGNSVGNQTASVTYSDGSTAQVAIASADSAKEVATALDSLAGVSASGFNSISFGTISASATVSNLTFNLYTGDATTRSASYATTFANTIATTDSATFDAAFDEAMASAVASINSTNSDNDLEYDADTNTLSSLSGVDLGVDVVFGNSAGSTTNLATMTATNNSGKSTTIVGTADAAISVGSVSVYVEDNVSSITSTNPTGTVATQGGVFNIATASAAAAISTTTDGLADVSTGNNVAQQNLPLPERDQLR
jgi:hypothetical protein